MEFKKWFLQEDAGSIEGPSFSQTTSGLYSNGNDPSFSSQVNSKYSTPESEREKKRKINPKKIFGAVSILDKLNFGKN